MLGNPVLLAGSFAVSCLRDEALAALNATFATRGLKQIQLPSERQITPAGIPFPNGLRQVSLRTPVPSRGVSMHFLFTVQISRPTTWLISANHDARQSKAGAADSHGDDFGQEPRTEANRSVLEQFPNTDFADSDRADWT
jgi:hypothetical protein